MDDKTISDLERRLAKLEREALRFRKGQVTATAPLEAKIGASDEPQEANTISGTNMAENDSVAAIANSSDLLLLGKLVDEPTGVSLTSTSEWSEQQYLTEPSALSKAGNQLGYSVAITSDGSRAVVGAPFGDILAQANEGFAALYKRTGTTWALENTFTYSLSAGSGYKLGYSVAINDAGDTIVVGSSNAAQTRVYTRSGSTWTEQAIISKNGLSAAISENGNTVALADPANTDVLIYTRSGTSWSLQATIDTPNNKVALSADGNTLAVGNPADSSSKGNVKVYTRSGSSWSLQATLTDSTGATGDNFGDSVSLADDGNTLVVGAPLDNVGSNTDQGSAVIYTRASTIWSQGSRLTYSGGAASDNFGTSVSINGAGDRIVVGQSNDDIGLNADRGSIVVFDYSGSVWDETTTLTAASGTAGDALGTSVAISDDGIYVVGGAPFDDVSTYSDHGSASVFALTTTTAAGVTVGDGTVTEAKLANNAVTSAKIADGTIVNADVNASAGITLSKLATDPLARANHTGTQTASTISDFDTQVRTNRLDQMATPTADVSFGSKKITSLADPSSAQDAATKTYVDTTASAGTPDADATTKGKIQLAGDLSGTAASPQIASGAIVNADINSSAAVALSKLASGSSAQIIVANGSGVPTYVAMSGDATISNAGAVDVTTVSNARAVVSKTTTQSLTSGNDANVSFNVEDIDPNGFFSSGADTKLTVPSGLGGLYLATFQAAFDTNSTNQRYGFIQVGGANTTPASGVVVNAVATFNTRIAGTFFLELDAADEVTLQVRQNSTSTINLTSARLGLLRIDS